MKKLVTLALVALSAIAFSARAETDYLALPRIDAIVNGDEQLVNPVVSGDLVVQDDVRVTDHLAAANLTTANLVSSGEVNFVSSSLTVTTLQIFALSTAPVIRLSTSGQPGLTMTNTIAAVGASYVGNLYTLVNVGTNGVIITDSAPVYNSGATLGQYDAVTYYVVATDQVVQVSTSNN